MLEWISAIVYPAVAGSGMLSNIKSLLTFIRISPVNLVIYDQAYEF